MTWLKIALVAVLVIGYAEPAQAVGDFSTVQIRGAKSADISNVVFGPVQQEDTLWKIAKDYRNSPDYEGQKPPSLYPVMYAIYLKNSQAFIDDNVNHLRNDVMLEMPSSSFINGLDLAESERKIESDESKWGYQDSTKTVPSPEGSQSTASTNNIEQTSANSITPSKNPVQPITTKPTKAVADVINQTENVASQQQIINEIRAQYAVSLETIQILLEENKKLSTQVNDVAQRVNFLANQVNVEVQSQLEEQAELQAHLFALLDNGAADEPEVETSPWVDDVKALMSEPLVVIGAVSMTVLVSLIIFGLWLFRRKQPEDVLDTDDVSSKEDTDEVEDVSESLLQEIGDTELVESEATEIDLNAIPDDIPDLIEETPAAEDPEEKFAGDLDGLIVPESADEQLNEDELRAQIEDIEFTPEDGEIDQSDLDALFADSGLDDSDILDESPEAEKAQISAETNAVDATDIDSLLAETQAESSAVGETDIDSLLAETQAESNAVDATDIDSLLEETQAIEESEPEDELSELETRPEMGESSIPENLDIDEYKPLDDEAINTLEQEIATQSQNIDKDVDNLLNELEQIEMMESMLGGDDTNHETAQDNDTDKVIDTENDTLGEPAPDDSDALADELLAELGATEDDALEEPVIDENDALADELLDELGLSDEIDNVTDSVVSDADDDFLSELNLDSVADEPSNSSVQEALTDDLLDELLGESLADTSDLGDIDDEPLPAAADDEPPLAPSAVDDAPALDDLDAWLTEDSDKQALDELENVDFDELLDSLDKDFATSEGTNDITELSDDILGDLSFDSFAESSLDDSTSQSVVEEDVAEEDSRPIAKDDVSADIPEYLDVDALLQETEDLEVGEPDLDVLKNIPGIPDAVPSSEVLQDDVFASNLDLARAYIEIDEFSEAQALLEGVVTEGTEEQVAEAKTLIEKLKSL